MAFAFQTKETADAENLDDLARMFVANAEEALATDDDAEHFNAALSFAQANELDASAMARILGLLKAGGATSSALLSSWLRDGASSLGETGAPRLQDDFVNQQLQRHATEVEWEHADVITELNAWFARINKRVFQSALAPAAISVARARRETLGWYLPCRDGLGLRYRINLNLVHVYRSRPLRIGILAHEVVHLWEDEKEGRRRGGRYHTKKFREKAQDIGVPTDNNGAFYGITAGSPLASLLAEQGIPLDETGTSEADATSVIAAASKPALQKWSCGCTNIYASRGVTVDGVCGKCDQRWTRHV